MNPVMSNVQFISNNDRFDRADRTYLLQIIRYTDGSFYPYGGMLFNAQGQLVKIMLNLVSAEVVDTYMGKWIWQAKFKEKAPKPIDGI